MENYISGLNDDFEDEHIPPIPRSSQQQSQSTAEVGSNSVSTTVLSTSTGGRVASKSAFSAGKRVLDDRRSRLAPDILDCLICLKDWEDERLGIVKRSAKDEFRDYFADSDIDND
ncbi:hypothetical protein Dimus_013505 [Dionaea muscipula]